MKKEPRPYSTLITGAGILVLLSVLICQNIPGTLAIFGVVFAVLMAVAFFFGGVYYGRYGYVLNVGQEDDHA